MGLLDGNTPAIIVTCLTVVMTFLRRYKPFRAWFASLFETSLSNYFLPSKQMVVSAPTFTLTKSPAQFQNHGNTTLYELIQSLTQLQEYSVRGQRQNGVIFNRARGLDPASREQLGSIGYFSKISTVNKSIEENYSSIKLVIKYVLKTLIKDNVNNDIDEYLNDQLKTICADFGYMINEQNELIHTGTDVVLATSESNQGRVIEALGHFCRDWSPSFDCERKPLNAFVHERIKLSLGNSTPEDVLIVVPGAGVGQLAYSISREFPACHVDSVEWSSLMHIFNQFALDSPENLSICPFAQYYSGHNDTKSQTRSMQVQLKNVTRPDNLTVHWGDFRQYIARRKNYKKVFVCTAFFIDTAENLFEYFQSIEQLSSSCDELHWINIGPLKYGTRPLVQLTASELNELRKARGWEDLHEDIVNNYNQGLNGYLTDYESLYQGYYGLLKFHSIRTKKYTDS